MKPSRLITRPDLHLQDFHGIKTAAPRMLELFEQIQRAGRSGSTILVRGASGTGKELVAQALHRCSPRASQPFRAVNCATFTPELLASELFGHVRGSFTGAIKDKHGLFRQADGGTLFLDEIAELPLELQARLLRVLQERRFLPVGGSEEVSVDVRVISATNAPLRRLVDEHRFREDLMYRVRVVVLYLPALVERSGDLEALTWHFLDGLAEAGLRPVEGIEAAAWDAMQAWSWPGNVRELHNALEHALVLGEGPWLRLTDLPPELQGEPPPGEVPQEAPARTLDDIQRTELLDALKQHGGRRDLAADHLGISRSTLYRRLKHHGLL